MACNKIQFQGNIAYKDPSQGYIACNKHHPQGDMRKVEILPKTDFWGFEISSK